MTPSRASLWTSSVPSWYRSCGPPGPSSAGAADRAALHRLRFLRAGARRLLGFPRREVDTLGRRNRVPSAFSRHPVGLHRPRTLPWTARVEPFQPRSLHFAAPLNSVPLTMLSRRWTSIHRCHELFRAVTLLENSNKSSPPASTRADVSAAREHARARRGGVRGRQVLSAPC